jgi:metallophosphoesterase (TIGR03768 family)
MNMKSGILRNIGGCLLALAPFTGSGGDVPPTTRQQTIRPLAVPTNTLAITPSQTSLYAVYGYSAWQVGPGEDAGRLFLTPGESTTATNAAQLLSFFSMSDIHITDKESPAQIPYFGWEAPYNGWVPPSTPAGDLRSQACSPVMLSTPQVLDAAVRTIDALHRANPFDFGIILGDVANSSQYNELRWFIDVMDGKRITPSSGAHLGAHTTDYQMPFEAAGLDRSIPWYEVIGNHDQMWMGVHYPTDKLRSAFVGTNVLNMYSNVFALNATELSGQYMGVVDGTSPYGEIIKGGLTEAFAEPPTVAADPDRHTMTTTNSSTTNFMSAFFDTTTLPVGHGFTQSNIESNSACYTFQPSANVPLKVIVLDNTCKTMLSDSVLYAALEPILGPDVAGALASTYAGYGWLDTARLSWLTNQLQMGQDSNQLMVLACHIPINPQANLDDTTPQGQFFPPNYAAETNLIGILHNYPNLIMVMAGHRHMNVVTPQPSPDPAHPEYGFWEVETPSLRDFPQQFRTWEILRNSDNTISVLTTDVDPVVAPGSPAAKSRGYAVGASRLFGKAALNDVSSHAFNAELVKTLSPAMQSVIANYGSPMPTALALSNTSGGSISPDWASTSYRVPGSNYTVTAVAAPGYAFTGWSGGIQTDSPVLTFTMEPGLVLQANFAPRPFVPANGVFNGLFYDSNGVTHQSSGFITLKTTVKRNFSGKLQIGGGAYSLSGLLDASGAVTKVIPRPHQSSLTLRLSLRGTDWMVGTVSNESWQGDVFADRAVYNSKTRPAPQSGRYTLVVAGTNGGSTLPKGSGYGTLTISKAGVISFAGSLADGTKISQSAPVSQEGQWPLYAPLYNGLGSVLGWLSLNDAGELDGSLSWTKPLTPAARYPSGFAWLTEASGARYCAPGKGSNILGAASSKVTLALAGGGLAANITNAFTLDANSRVKTPSLSNRLTLSFTLASGLFRGTQIIPGTGKTVSFSGVVLQGQTNSAGYFLGTEQSGQVSLGDAGVSN